MQKHWLAQCIEEIGTQTRLFGSGIVELVVRFFAWVWLALRWVYSSVEMIVRTAFNLIWKMFSLGFRFAMDILIMLFISAIGMHILRLILARADVQRELARIGSDTILLVTSVIGLIAIAMLMRNALREWRWAYFVSYTLVSWFILLRFMGELSPLVLLTPFGLADLYVNGALLIAAGFTIFTLRGLWRNPGLLTSVGIFNTSFQPVIVTQPVGAP